MTNKKYYYEVLWYEGKDIDSALSTDYVYEEFTTYQKAISYYHQHKNDENKYGWLVTKRNEYGEIVETYIY